MYCFRCGKKLPGREINCPDCDSPKKKRLRKHKRMLLGLFIFLSGAIVGSIFDKYVFKGDAWKHTFLYNIFTSENKASQSNVTPSEKKQNEVKVKMQYGNSELSNEVPVIKNNPNETNINTNISNNSDKYDSHINSNVSPNEKDNLKKNISDESEIKKNKIINNSSSEDKDQINQLLELPPAKGIINPTENKQTQNNENETSNEENVSLINQNQDQDNISNQPSETDSNITNNKSEEVEIVEEKENDINLIEANPVEETVVSNNDSTLTDNESLSNFPKGKLTFKNISLLEQGEKDSYHGFISKNGKELIFASNRSNYKGKPTYQCFIKSPNANAKATKAFEWKGNIWTPELTPDSNWIVFSSDSQGTEHLYLYDRKSGNSIPLTSGKSKDMMPSISPDGKKVAFVSNRSGKNCIYVLDIFNSKNVKQITKAKVDDREPRWTSDGKSIIFTRIHDKMKVSNIMKVNIDSIDEPIDLVSSKNRNWMADISPDNKILAFTRSLSDNGSKNIIVLKDLETGKEEPLTFNGVSESMRPVWNSDCSGFVFHIRKSSGSSIYKANFTRD